MLVDTCGFRVTLPARTRRFISPGPPCVHRFFPAIMAAVTVAASLCPLSTAGQAISLEPGQARVTLTADADFRSGAFGQSTMRRISRESLVLPFSGYLITPTTIRFGARVSPTLRQQVSSDLPTALSSRGVDYAVEASLLSSRRISGDVQWSRSTGRIRGGLGVTGDYASKSFSAAGRIRSRWLPISASYADRRNDQQTRVGPARTPIELLDRVQSLRVSASTSKLTVVYDRMVRDDRLDGTRQRTRYLDAGHRLAWGKGSDFRTSLRWSRRTEPLDFNRFSWREQLRLQHTRRSSSRWSHRFVRSQSGGVRTVGRASTGEIRIAAHRTVTVGARATSNHTRYNGSKQRALQAGPTLSIQTPLPVGGRLSARGELSYLDRDVSMDGTAIIAVIDQPLAVSNSALILIEQTDVDLTSVQLTSDDGRLIYSPGLDYQLSQPGAFVQIEIVPGSRIPDEGTILASYRFVPRVEAREAGVVSAGSLSLRIAGFTASHTRSHRATQIDADDGGAPVGDYNQHSTVLTTARAIPIGRIRARLGHRARSTERIDYTTREFDVSLDTRPRRKIRPSLVTGFQRIRDRTATIAQWSFGTTILAALHVGARGGVTMRVQQWSQTFREGPQPIADQWTTSGAAWYSYRFRSVDLNVRYRYDRRTTPFVSNGHRISIEAIRRF